MDLSMMYEDTKLLSDEDLKEGYFSVLNVACHTLCHY